MNKKGTSTCRNGEGFVKLARVKIPDSSTRTRVRMRMRRVKSWHGDLMDTRTYLDMGQDYIHTYDRVDAITLGRKKRSLDCMIVFLLCGTGMLTGNFQDRENMRVEKAIRMLYGDYKFSLRLATGSTYLEDSTADVDETRINSDLPFFDLATISVAANNFSVANKLGKGGFGTVRI
ncbi:hypothetical protein PRUPE_4G031300 [Prunus persica]|uniref:Uncharacterized protein n=1 Tax=Prunus persica TaxID=3760 RepID=A0A251PGK1_PRUPE|nr:hypothetical protein PRUPE_4G031300 [Prunus persica]